MASIILCSFGVSMGISEEPNCLQPATRRARVEVFLSDKRGAYLAALRDVPVQQRAEVFFAAPQREQFAVRRARHHKCAPDEALSRFAGFRVHAGDVLSPYV